MQVIVRNHMKKPIAYSAAIDPREGQPRVQLARVLSPGSNQVDAKEFEASTKKSPVWAKWIEDGDVTVHGEGKGIADMKPTEAIVVVKDTLSVAQLEAWSAEETRADVKKAIAKQLKELEKKLPKAPEAS